MRRYFEVHNGGIGACHAGSNNGGSVIGSGGGSNSGDCILDIRGVGKPWDGERHYIAAGERSGG